MRKLQEENYTQEGQLKILRSKIKALELEKSKIQRDKQAVIDSNVKSRLLKSLMFFLPINCFFLFCFRNK